MAGRHKHTVVNQMVAGPVHGLEYGLDRARRNAARQRRKNATVTGMLLAVLASIAAVAAWLGWQVYSTETEPTDRVVEERTPQEVIDLLEEQPAWNGPGNPAFGIGD
jgi:hypothetical protein